MSSSRRASSTSPRRRREQVDHLAAGQLGPEVHVAGHVGQATVEVHRVAPRITAEQRHLARVGPQQTEQHPDRRRLAGAVRPEEAVHLARLDHEVEPVERPAGTERLDEPADGDDRGHPAEAIDRFPLHAQAAPGTPDREREGLGGLDVDEEGLAVGAEGGAGELLCEPRREGAVRRRVVAGQPVQGDVEQGRPMAEAADVVVDGAVLAQHDRPAVAARRDVVRAARALPLPATGSGR